MNPTIDKDRGATLAIRDGQGEIVIGLLLHTPEAVALYKLLNRMGLTHVDCRRELVRAKDRVANLRFLPSSSPSTLGLETELGFAVAATLRSGCLLVKPLD